MAARLPPALGTRTPCSHRGGTCSVTRCAEPFTTYRPLDGGRCPRGQHIFSKNLENQQVHHHFYIKTKYISKAELTMLFFILITGMASSGTFHLLLTREGSTCGDAVPNAERLNLGMSSVHKQFASLSLRFT